jgi:hypothetical protein
VDAQEQHLNADLYPPSVLEFETSPDEPKRLLIEPGVGYRFVRIHG